MRLGHPCSQALDAAPLQRSQGAGRGVRVDRARCRRDRRSLSTSRRSSARPLRHQPVLLLFENGDARLPIIVGLIQPEPGAALFQSLLAPAAPAPSPRPPAPRRGSTARRVVLEGTDEVTLKCGAASITLRRDGKVILPWRLRRDDRQGRESDPGRQREDQLTGLTAPRAPADPGTRPRWKDARPLRQSPSRDLPAPPRRDPPARF